MTHMHRLTAAGLVATTAFMLAGCAEGEPTPRVENQPTAVETTPVAREETPEEFIRRWFKVTKDMQNTGDATEYLAMSKDCAYCKETAEMIKGYYAAGGAIEFEGDQINSVVRYRNAKTTFLVKTRVLPTEYTTASGAPVQHFKGGNDQYIVTLEKVGGSWQVLDMTSLAS